MTLSTAARVSRRIVSLRSSCGDLMTSQRSSTWLRCNSSNQTSRRLSHDSGQAELGKTLASLGIADDDTPIKTALYDLHKELGGEMVPFAGYELPVQYKGSTERGGVLKEHLWCRSEGKCSLFDVSHMGQIQWRGEDRIKFLETIVVSDIAGLPPGSGCLSLITNGRGGIMDDTVIVNDQDVVHMVVNGATKWADLDHFKKQMEQFAGKVHMHHLEEEWQLLALQGPGAAAALAKILPGDFDLKNMAFMTGAEATLDGIKNCRITRCGYTGEDGFELSMPRSCAVSIASKLLEDPTVNPAGLGARDSLRIEAGLCLYGHDIDGTTTPVEAGLGWTLGPPNGRRRTQGGFYGSVHILTKDGKFEKYPRKRVGIKGMKAPAREETEIYDATGEEYIGAVTSGTFSPVLKEPIAMGYVKTEYSKLGTTVQVKIRNKLQTAQITKMPFVESRYYRVPEQDK